MNDSECINQIFANTVNPTVRSDKRAAVRRVISGGHLPPQRRRL